MVNIILLVFGMMFLAVGIYILLLENSAKKFKKKGIPVTAKIYDIEKSWSHIRNTRSRKSSISVKAFITFYTNNNEEIDTKLDYASTTMKVGQEIPIVYDKDDPYKIKVNTKGSSIFSYVMSILFIGIGLPIVIVAIIGFFK